MFLSRFLSIASRFSKDGTSTTIFHMGSDPAQHFFPSFFSETFRSTAPIIFWCSKSTIKSWFFPKQWSFKWDLTRIVEAKEAGGRAAGKPRPSLDFGKSSQRPQNILANSESDTCVYIYISMRIAITCNNNNQIIFSDVFFSDLAVHCGFWFSVFGHVGGTVQGCLHHCASLHLVGQCHVHLRMVTCSDVNKYIL